MPNEIIEHINLNGTTYDIKDNISPAASITSSDITNWNNKVSDDKTWNGVELAKQSATNSGDSTYVPLATSTSPLNMSFTPVKKTPTANAIAKYDNSSYIYSTTPSARDNSTKVATTAYVDGVAVPSGGTTGQFLVKKSNTNYDMEWITVSSANGESF